MNELDYVRDNRLRLWFIERKMPVGADIARTDRAMHFKALLRDTFIRLLDHFSKSANIILVVGDTRRGGARLNAASAVKSVFKEARFQGRLVLEEEIVDRIPDVRRSRRDLSGTKRETILRFSYRAARRPI
jgi:hypothetical protein